VSVAARLAAFGLALAALLAAAAAVGGAVGPLDRGGGEAAGGHGEEEMPGEVAPPGLSLAADRLRLELGRTTLAAGRAQELSLRVLDEDGEPLREYDVTHERLLHLIVVRRDLTGFQHLHPEQDADGAWTATAGALEPGAYRVFADFSTGGEKRTLGADLFVPGGFDPEPLPASAAAADGVELRAAELAAGEEARLEFAVPGVEVERYLGARGHLVILREGDLAYLHTHAEEDELAFETTFPSAGRYRAFLQFSAGGEVRTVAFTLEVGG
jgi:hypothetical protein